MITSYKQLTGKYLKASLRRTILTIIGIVLSVSLISSIGFFVEGIRDAELQAVKDNYGSAHLYFQKVDPDLLSKISNHPKVARSGLYIQGEQFKFADSFTVNEMIVTDQAVELLPLRISSGRMPENSGECAVEKWAIRFIDPQASIGDKIRVGDKEYTLTGLLQDQVGSQINHEAMLVTKVKQVDPAKAVLLVEISSKTNLEKAVKELKELGEPGTVSENLRLLLMLGVGVESSDLRGVFVAVGVVIAIVVIATIAVIYNAFQISVVERVKQFGLLRTIGSTPKQIRKIVFREATFLALIGVPLGLFFGVVAIYVIGIIFAHLVDDSMLSVQTAISPQILLISSGVGLLSIYASALIPALYAGRISPLVAVSSRALISKEKLKRRKTRLWSKLFGFEGELAIKNIRRNPKRYRITIFSIIISVVLFVTFTSFVDMSFNIAEELNESKRVHFSIVRANSVNEDKVRIEEEMVQKIRNLDFVEKLYQVYPTAYFTVAMDPASEIKGEPTIEGITDHITVNGKDRLRLWGSIAIYDPASIEITKKYLESGSIDPEKLNRENGVIIIGKHSIYNQAIRKNYYGPIVNVKVGDEIELQLEESKARERREFGAGTVQKVKVMAIVDEPFNFRGLQAGLKIITTEEVGKRLTGAAEIKPINLNIILKDVKYEEDAREALSKIIAKNPTLRVINLVDQNRQTKSAILMIQILLYGFVVVVSCIGSVNIINTITTNIILRKREMSTLKAIGLTQKGLKKMIAFEGILYGLLGTIYGSVIAVALSYVLFRGITAAGVIPYEFPWKAILIAGAASLSIGYLSVLAPLKRIKRENLIDAVREDY